MIPELGALVGMVTTAPPKETKTNHFEIQFTVFFVTRYFERRRVFLFWGCCFIFGVRDRWKEALTKVLYEFGGLVLV